MFVSLKVYPETFSEFKVFLQTFLEVVHGFFHSFQKKNPADIFSEILPRLPMDFLDAAPAIPSEISPAIRARIVPDIPLEIVLRTFQNLHKKCWNNT